MTFFAQLESGPTLSKSAAPLKAGLAKAHNLLRDGVWKTVARKYDPTTSGWRGYAGRASRLFHDPTVGKLGKDGLLEGKSTLLNKGLTTYGLGGLGLSMAGYNVPGSDLALNAAMPVAGLSTIVLPSLISSARLSSQNTKDKIEEDAKLGARSAIGDIMSLAQTDSRYASQPGLYSQYMSQYSPATTAQAFNYRNNVAPAPMSAWNTLASIVSNPQELVNRELDQRLPPLMNKAGRLKSVANAVGNVLPWLTPAVAVGATAHAVFGDKPYDAQQVQQKGYAAAQSAMQEKLQNLNFAERLALRMDPTLLAQKADKMLPGTISQWEQSTGQRYNPGFLAGALDKWNKGGESDYYQYDAAGKRHYV